MKKFFISLITVIILVQGCTSDKKKVVEFNNKIAKLSVNYMGKAKELAYATKTAITIRDFSKLQKPYDELLKILEDDISQITEIENLKGSENMKAVLLDYLKFEKDAMEKSYGPFLKMTKSTTDKEIRAAAENMIELSKKESTYLAKVRAAQREFADKNGFKVSPNSY